jgi:hypothetical protein
VIADAPRAVGLHRMFASTSENENPAADLAGPVPSGSASFASAAYGTDAGHFPTSGPSHDISTNTVTFSPPIVQREAETGSQEAPSSDPAPTPEPAAPASGSASMVSTATAAGAAAKELNVDELVNNLYDTLAARLRAELWLDRERAGVLMDLGR